MSAHHCYHGMEYSEDRAKIAEWAPLIIEGRTEDEPIAATRIITGTRRRLRCADPPPGRAALSSQPGFDLHYNRHVVGA